MSIEQNIERMATALEKIAAVLQQSSNEPSHTVSVPTSAPTIETPIPTMPEIPTFEPLVLEVPAPQATVSAPFTDQAGLITYITGAYQAMGAEKGAGIQTILQELGVQMVNQVTPEQYGELYQKVEALKQ